MTREAIEALLSAAKPSRAINDLNGHLKANRELLAVAPEIIRQLLAENKALREERAEAVVLAERHTANSTENLLEAVQALVEKLELCFEANRHLETKGDLHSRPRDAKDFTSRL